MRRAGSVNGRWDNPNAYNGKYPPDWDARRKIVYQRDDYTCQQCGRQSGPYAGDGGVVLHAHHRQPLGDGGWNQLGNLETVCQNCHDRIHGHRTGRSYGGSGFNGIRVLRGLGRLVRRCLRYL